MKILITKSRSPGPPGPWVTLIWSIPGADARHPLLGFARGGVSLAEFSHHHSPARRGIFESTPTPTPPHPLPVVGSGRCFSFMEIPLLYCNLLVPTTWRRRCWAFELVTALPSGTLCVLMHSSSTDSLPISVSLGPREAVNETGRKRWFWDPGGTSHFAGWVAQRGGGPDHFLTSSNGRTTHVHMQPHGAIGYFRVWLRRYPWVCTSGAQTSFNLCCDRDGKAQLSLIDLSEEGCLRAITLTGCHYYRMPRPALFAGLHFNQQPLRFGKQVEGLLPTQCLPRKDMGWGVAGKLPQVFLLRGI